MTKTLTYQLTDTLAELNRIFNLFNTKIFDDKLELPVIVVNTRTKRAMGTCSVNRIWLHKTLPNEDFTTNIPNTKYEITISAEYLNRPVEEICATLLHEMVHLYNGLNKVEDTSNNYVYHNKKFKTEAEKRGLIIEHAKTIGWSVTTLKPETKELIKSFNINEQVFEYYRKGTVYVPKVKVDILTKEEKVAKLYERIEKIKDKISKLEAKGE